MKEALLILMLLPAWLTLAQEAALPRLANIPANRSFTFVVFGDNRGDDSGVQPAAFAQVLKAVEREKPDLILDSGDMIYGHNSDDAKIRDEWRIYREKVSTLRAPIFHVPGNHDVWDEASAQRYHELWGPTYYAFTYGNTHFIGLDTETDLGRINDRQFHWLEQEFNDCKQPNIFIFLHRPLFPVDGGIGSSLDAEPARRDQLHQLFIQHQNQIRAVFAGHEHLYNYQLRDGIPYYTSGGAGAPLYTAPELGGFHHFLTVHVSGDRANVRLHRVSAPTSRLLKPRIIRTGEILERWEQGLFCYAWDHSANIELTSAETSQGRRALRLNFDLEQYVWPVLVLPFASPRDFSDCTSISMDVYVPKDLPRGFTLTTAAQASDKHEAHPVSLEPGWNTVSTPLGPLLSASERRIVQGLEWSLTATDQHVRGYAIFDNVRVHRVTRNEIGETELLEGWESPLLWRVFDETVRAEIAAGNDRKPNGLLLHLDCSKCNRPVVFAQLNPPWDLSRIGTLALYAQTADSVPPDLTFGFSFRSNDIEFAAPPMPLSNGTNRFSIQLDERWLPRKTKAAVEQIAFRFVTTNTTGNSDILLRNLSAAGTL